MGEKCISNTIEIIKYFQPKYWYIENPKLSLMWKYITLNRTDFYDKNKMFLNETSYGKYNYPITKATIFLSNVKMNLLKGKIKPIYHIEIINKQKYYVLNDDANIKLRKNLNSRMIGLSNLNTIIKAKNGPSGIYGVEFVRQQNKINQKNKQSTHQISESGIVSMIPHLLIKDIFSYFKFNI